MAIVYEPIVRTAPSRPLPAEVPRVLGRLRQRVLRYLAGHAAARVVLWAAIAFWIGLAIDWCFEPTRSVRAAALIVFLTTLTVMVALSVWRIARAPLGAKNLALLLERRFPKLGESLLTIVDLAEQPEAPRFAPELLAVTERQALAELDRVQLRQVFNPRPLRRRLGLMAAMVAAIVALVAVAPVAAKLYVSRALLLSDEPWPRDTRLTVEGFHDGRARVARGSDFLVQVLADPQGVVPDDVRLWYRGQGESWLSVDLPRRDEQAEGPARYEHPLASVVDSLELEVEGGDARLRNLRLEVVEPPRVAEVRLECRFPKYLDRADAVIPLATAGPLPEGTEVTARLTTSKPIAAAAFGPDDASGAPRELKFSALTEEFAIPLGVLGTKPTPWSVELTDDNGIRSQPWRLELASVADQPPKLSAQPRGLGGNITPQARIPWRGNAQDDYGLAQLGWATRSADGSQQIQVFADLSETPREAPIDQAFDVAPLELKPGDQLQLAVAGRDRWDLGPEPHVGYSEWIVRKVVEPDELRSELEARELNLRRRVEKVAADLDALADSLSRLDPQAADEETRQAQRLQSERGLEDVRQARGELRSVSSALAELRDEGTANQVLSEEARSRLDSGVIEPLGQLAEEQGGRLAERLEQLRAAITEPQGQRGPARDAAAAENDEARRQVQRILERMRQRETLHEVVELLRGILRDQTELNAATRQQRQQGLLEELGE